MLQKILSFPLYPTHNTAKLKEIPDLNKKIFIFLMVLSILFTQTYWNFWIKLDQKQLLLWIIEGIIWTFIWGWLIWVVIFLYWNKKWAQWSLLNVLFFNLVAYFYISVLWVVFNIFPFVNSNVFFILIIGMFIWYCRLILISLGIIWKVDRKVVNFWLSLGIIIAIGSIFFTTYIFNKFLLH